MSSPYYIAGLDLGQAADYTALSVAEIEHDPKTRELLYSIRKLERWPLRTPYPKVIADVDALVRNPTLARRTTLVVDATGVGRPVVDALRAARLPVPLIPVLITGGDTTTHDHTSGMWRCPKRDLAGALAVVMQNRRLKVAPELEHAATLLKEMQTFKVTI